MNVALVSAFLQVSALPNGPEIPAASKVCSPRDVTTLNIGK